jgi:hypothetical protein
MSHSFVLRCCRMTTLVAALAILAPASHSWAAQKSQPITLDSSITIVESAQEPGPVRKATGDLLSDFTKVFGRRPALANQLEDSGPVAILITEQANVHPGINCKHVVCLTGADMRGTIYAIYEFSQKILGVDPMYSLDRQRAGKRTSIPLPADFTRVYPSPFSSTADSFPTTKTC